MNEDGLNRNKAGLLVNFDERPVYYNLRQLAQCLECSYSGLEHHLKRQRLRFDAVDGKGSPLFLAANLPKIRAQLKGNCSTLWVR